MKLRNPAPLARGMTFNGYPTDRVILMIFGFSFVYNLPRFFDTSLEYQNVTELKVANNTGNLLHDVIVIQVSSLTVHFVSLKFYLLLRSTTWANRVSDVFQPYLSFDVTPHYTISSQERHLNIFFSLFSQPDFEVKVPLTCLGISLYLQRLCRISIQFYVCLCDPSPLNTLSFYIPFFEIKMTSVNELMELRVYPFLDRIPGPTPNFGTDRIPGQ